MKFRSILTSAALATGLAAMLALSGCGPQAFLVVPQNQRAQAPGQLITPPKIDLMLAEDNTGSMYSMFSSVQAQVPTFLSQLEQRGWDYHFATTPLVTLRPTSVNQVAAGHFDGNYGSQWVSPYPGAVASSMTLPSSFFRFPSQYTGYVSISEVSNQLNGLEPGFTTINQALRTGFASTGFQRQDAVLVLAMIGNGNDTSGVTFCVRPDQVVVPCEQWNPSQGTYESSLQGWINNFQGMATNEHLSADVRFYSAVAYNQGTCLGSPARYGDRYIRMATALNGSSIDVCTQSVSQFFDHLASRLETLRLNLRQRYLVLNREPNVSTIHITKYLQGNASQPVVIPQGAVNGWTYVGYQTVKVIDAPVEMNQATGYIIELHGTAKLLGNDTADVQFTPVGQSSSG